VQPAFEATYVGQYRPMLCPFTQASPLLIPVKSIATGLVPDGAAKVV